MYVGLIGMNYRMIMRRMWRNASPAFPSPDGPNTIYLITFFCLKSRYTRKEANP